MGVWMGSVATDFLLVYLLIVCPSVAINVSGYLLMVVAAVVLVVVVVVVVVKMVVVVVVVNLSFGFY